MGRAMSLTDEIGFYLDPFGEQATGIANLVNGRAWGARSNAVTFNSAKFGGFSFRLQRGFGNVAGSFRASSSTSASVTYTSASVGLYGVYEEIRDDNGRLSSLYGASREFMAGATYAFNSAKFYAGYAQLYSSGKDTLPDSLNPVGATRANQEWVGLTYQLTPALILESAVFHGNVNHGGGSATLGVLGANYSLSKRTMLYSTLGLMFNRGQAQFPVETGNSAPLPGKNQQGVYAGVMHYF